MDLYLAGSQQSFERIERGWFDGFIFSRRICIHRRKEAGYWNYPESSSLL